MELPVSAEREPISQPATAWEGQDDVEPRGDGGAGLVFWLLIALSVAGFAPCLILPAWRQFQQAALTEQIAAAEVEALHTEVERQRRLIDAIHNDPVVVSRLARRELGYRRPGEVIIPVSVDSEPLTDDAVAALSHLALVDPPVPVKRLLAYAPNWNYDALFCESPSRETILGLSIALFIAAFVIFWPKPDHDHIC